MSFSIITPVLNSERVIKNFLDNITKSTKNLNFEIIFADGGSNDKTLEIIDNFKNILPIRVYDNPKKDFESGRVVGIKNSKYDIIFFLDSDNFITDTKFFLKFLKAYEDENILAAEPSSYTYMKDDNIANKIHSLIGCADPISVFIKNYAHYSNISKKLMGINFLNINKRDFVKIKFIDKIPTIGANGFTIRKKALQKLKNYKNFSDIGRFVEFTSIYNNYNFAKIKTNIYHKSFDGYLHFCFKQKRRIKLYLLYRNKRINTGYNWSTNRIGLFNFILANIFVLPLIIQATIGFFNKNSKAWFFYPLYSLTTFYIYSFYFLTDFFRKTSQYKFENYKT